MSIVSQQNSIAEINAEKPFAVKQATSGASATIDLSTVNMPLGAPGTKVCNASGISQPMLMLQCDQDFYYAFGTTSGGSVTLPAGANPGVFVPAGFEEYVRPASQPLRTFLYVIQASVAGTMRVYVSRASSGA